MYKQIIETFPQQLHFDQRYYNTDLTVYEEDDEFFNKECGTLYKKSREAGMSICHVYQLMCD